jgi:hypothetical protein
VNTLDSSEGSIFTKACLMFIFSSDSYFSKLFPYFKWTVFGLLGINMVLFFIHQTAIEGIESLAWLVLLLLFEWETSQLDQPYISSVEKWSIHIGRILAYILIIYSAYEYTTSTYIQENGPTDMYNAATWLLIVFLLEYDVYFPRAYKKWEWHIRNIFKTILYVALFLIALWWWIDGEFFDFYDALLWIICFFFIELNIFIFEEEISFEEQV